MPMFALRDGIGSATSFGLILVLPFLTGERSTGWVGDARAAVLGLSAATSPEDILRGVMEGVAAAYEVGIQNTTLAMTLALSVMGSTEIAIPAAVYSIVMNIFGFAFGMGGPLANFAGLLHMTMHSLTKSAIFFAVGHVAQAKGTQRITDISGLSTSHPVLAVGLAIGVIAIAGMPPFGVFTSEFMLLSSTFARQPLLAVALVFGLVVAFGALMLRLSDVLFGEPSGSPGKVKATYVPLFLHLALVLAAGLWLPEPVVRWFRAVAAQLG